MAGSSRSDIISVLKSEIADFEAKTQVNETGRIISINDGIVNIYGLNHAMYGELVEFETGVKGIVQNVERKTLGCVLLGSDHGLTEGSKVVRTQKRAGVGVGEKLLGRVVDALGAPIDGMGEIEYDDYTLSNAKPQAFATESLLQCLWKQVYFLSTQCSLSAEVSVSLS